jgi:zinc D-Ala-D-Ala dipeptidase
MLFVNRRSSVITAFCLVLFACFSSVFVPSILPSQTQPSREAALVPAPKPAEAPLEWKQLVGIYEYNKPKQVFVILERGQHLFLQDLRGVSEEISEQEGKIVWIGDETGRFYGYSEQHEVNGSVTELSYLLERYTRIDAGADPAHFFHVAPTKPVAELRSEALREAPPKEAGQFRKPDLVELASLDPGFHLEIRYAQSNNFLSTPIYTQARAFLQRPAAEALHRVLGKLQPLGYGLLIHDAYRPWYVTKIFWDATPSKDHNFVADPQKGSKHNRGCAVDLTLYDSASGIAVEMPGLYDEMSPRSFPTFPGGTSLQRWHRDLLRRAMESEGFTVDGNEWWHFDYKDWKRYPILNISFEDLGNLVGPAGARS